jgi:hypothetical protein
LAKTHLDHIDPYQYVKPLFTSRVFRGIGGDYPVSQNIFDSSRLGLEGIILRYPHKSLHISAFLARLETICHSRVFFGKNI